MGSSEMSKVGRLAAVAGAVAVLFSVFLLTAPWRRAWGASEREVAATLPGDELLEASATSTRAISIAAPPAHVWPWLAQIGQDRGGFYSYELLEDLVGARMENLETVRPELQRWEVGDRLWMYPPERLSGAGHGVLLRADPGRALVFGTRRMGRDADGPYDGVWSFVVAPAKDGGTRLIVRSRAAHAPSLSVGLFEASIFEPVHFVMERKMMEGIKARAEGERTSELNDDLEVLTYAGCALLFVVAAVGVVRSREWKRRLMTLLAAGLAFQALTFLQPAWPLGLLVVVVIGMACAEPPTPVGAAPPRMRASASPK